MQEEMSAKEYERKLLGFMSILHDMVLADADFSAKSIEYIIDNVETLGERINNFPFSHPIFEKLANSKSITHEAATKIIALSDSDLKVYKALSKNVSLPENERTFFALNS